MTNNEVQNEVIYATERFFTPRVMRLRMRSLEFGRQPQWAFLSLSFHPSKYMFKHGVIGARSQNSIVIADWKLVTRKLMLFMNPNSDDGCAWKRNHEQFHETVQNNVKYSKSMRIDCTRLCCMKTAVYEVCQRMSLLQKDTWWSDQFLDIEEVDNMLW